MSVLDASFLQLENDVQHMHVGSALIFEGPPPTYDEFTEAFECRLTLVPRYRQRPYRLPLDVGRPLWVDDQFFDLSHHLKHTAVPAPGGDQQLRTLVGRLMSTRMDRTYPLWEAWLVEGLAGDRWAIVNKVHHAMIDGVSGHDIIEMILDREPDAEHPPQRRWRPAPLPSRVSLVASGASGAVAAPLGQLGSLAGAVRSPRRLATSAFVRARGIGLMGQQYVRRPSTVLNGPLTPHRRWEWARATLAEAKVVRTALGGTVNDVVLAAITGGFRDYLAGRGEDVEDRVVRSMVPVSVRAPEQKGRLGNQVTAMFADLPVGIADPADRLRAVSAQLDALKSSGMAIGMHSLISAADFVPPTLFALGARASSVVPQRYISTVTTNVPGPPFPLYFRGRRLLEMFPYIPLGADVRITIGIVSYCGELGIGLTGDRDAVPDLAVLARGVERGFADLVAAAS